MEHAYNLTVFIFHFLTKKWPSFAREHMTIIILTCPLEKLIKISIFFIFLISWACFERLKNMILQIIKSKPLFNFLHFLFFFWKKSLSNLSSRTFYNKKKHFFEEFDFSFFDFFWFFWIWQLLNFSSRAFYSQSFFSFLKFFLFFFNFLISWACFENLKNIIM